MPLVASELLTVEQYARLPDTGRPTELVRGRIVYHGDRPVRILTAAQDFVVPDVLGEFRVQVADFFR
jgi:hypothetical protein